MVASPDPIVIGLISDTHGTLRSSVHQALADVDLILHAGDVGGDDILLELHSIAPVHAVFGNTDDPADPKLQESIEIEINGVRMHVSHGHELGSPTPAKLVATYPHDVIVYGHTHRQLVQRVGHQLVVNPGAAGPRRFDLEPSVARLTIANGRTEVAIVPVD